MPVVVYLHGNTSNRLEAWDLVVPFLKRGVSLFCFDAAGCGISEGEYISLGWHERHDLADIVKHLRKSCFCGPIALWGWSMGAATALLYADSDPLLSAMCLESPFASLRELVEELAHQGSEINIHLPNWLIDPVIGFVKMRVQELADFDIDVVLPRESAKKAKAPAIFVSRRDDTFVQHHHAEDLLGSYGGQCQHVMLEGDHSCTRTADDIKKVVDFFRASFYVNVEEQDIELRIPEEHGNRVYTPMKCACPGNTRPAPTAWWPETGAVPGEGLRSKPLFYEPAGIDFPEPKPFASSPQPTLLPLRPEPAQPRTASKSRPHLASADLPMMPIAAEPIRSQPLQSLPREAGIGVTAKPR